MENSPGWPAAQAMSIAVNGFTAWLFASGRKDDLNIQGAFLHMAGDAAVSAGRVLVNTTLGVLGLGDPASTMGLEKANEDFGQTFLDGHDVEKTVHEFGRVV